MSVWSARRGSGLCACVDIGVLVHVFTCPVRWSRRCTRVSEGACVLECGLTFNSDTTGSICSPHGEAVMFSRENRQERKPRAGWMCSRWVINHQRGWNYSHSGLKIKVSKWKKKYIHGWFHKNKNVVTEQSELTRVTPKPRYSKTTAKKCPSQIWSTFTFKYPTIELK